MGGGAPAILAQFCNALIVFDVNVSAIEDYLLSCNAVRVGCQISTGPGKKRYEGIRLKVLAVREGMYV